LTNMSVMGLRRFFHLVEVVEVEGESLRSKVVGEARADADANGKDPHQNIGVGKSMVPKSVAKPLSKHTHA